MITQIRPVFQATESLRSPRRGTPLTQIKAQIVINVANGNLAPRRAREDDMRIQQIHHVAYRCKDAKETVDFYKRVMNMDLLGAIAEDKVPSTKAPDPYMHIFLDAGAGNILAFFELPNSPAMGRDPNTPDWTQHIAFQVEDMNELLEAKARAETTGLEVVGPTDHTIFKSIYFWDPSGHRLEVATWTATPEQLAQMKAVAPAMVEEWSRTKKPPRHTAWLHAQEFAATE